MHIRSLLFLPMEYYFANFLVMIKVTKLIQLQRLLAMLLQFLVIKAVVNQTSSISMCTYCDPRNHMGSILVTKLGLDVGLVAIIYCLLLSCALSAYY